MKEFDFSKCLNKDEKNEVLRGYHYESGYMVVSDQHVLAAVKAPYNPEWEGRTIDGEGKDLAGVYPDWKGILPKASEYKSVRIQELRDRLNPSMEAVKSRKDYTDLYIGMVLGRQDYRSFRLQRFVQMLDFAEVYGIDKLFYDPDSNHRAAMALAKGAAALFLLMPSYIAGEFPDGTITDDWGRPVYTPAAPDTCTAVVPYTPMEVAPVSSEEEATAAEEKPSKPRAKRGPDYWRIRSHHPMTLEEIERSSGQFKVYTKKPSNRLFLGGGVMDGVSAAAYLRQLMGKDLRMNYDPRYLKGHKFQIREKYLGVVYEWEYVEAEAAPVTRKPKANIFRKVAGLFRRMAMIF